MKSLQIKVVSFAFLLSFFQNWNDLVVTLASRCVKLLENYKFGKKMEKLVKNYVKLSLQTKIKNQTQVIANWQFKNQEFRRVWWWRRRTVKCPQGSLPVNDEFSCEGSASHHSIRQTCLRGRPIAFWFPKNYHCNVNFMHYKSKTLIVTCLTHNNSCRIVNFYLDSVRSVLDRTG